MLSYFISCVFVFQGGVAHRKYSVFLRMGEVSKFIFWYLLFWGGSACRKYSVFLRMGEVSAVHILCICCFGEEVRTESILYFCVCMGRCYGLYFVYYVCFWAGSVCRKYFTILRMHAWRGVTVHILCMCINVSNLIW